MELQPLEEVLRPVESLDEEDSDKGREQPEDEVEDQLAGVLEGISWDGEGRLASQDRAGDDRAEDRGDHQGDERAGLKLQEDQFDGEEDPRDRGVEGRRDRSGRPAADEDLEVLGAEPEELAEGRAGG
jgi:hypothetical protein